MKKFWRTLDWELFVFALGFIALGFYVAFTGEFPASRFGGPAKSGSASSVFLLFGLALVCSALGFLVRARKSRR